MEQSSRPENIMKEKVLEMLKENGFEHDETKRLVMEWTIQQEKAVVTIKDSIIFNISRADLYIAIGDIDGAEECLRDALLQTEQEGEIELRMSILERL